MNSVETQIDRQRTAIHRTEMSRPIRLALGDHVIGADVLDYGCGRGDDVRFLNGLGISARGWDPLILPTGDRSAADTVNLGFVLNVIEHGPERADTLRSAWSLSKSVLIVSARLVNEARDVSGQAYGDGCLTKTRTFQKFYEQNELRLWIESVLGVSPVAAAPGVFYVFRDEDRRESFVASRVRRRTATFRASRAIDRFSSHQELLSPLLEFLETRGRLPREEESHEFAALIEAFGSLKRAYRVVVRATGEEPWTRARNERSQDILVYLALARFGGRPRRKVLPVALNSDVRAFFGTYRKACEAGDELLFRAGSQHALDEAFASAIVGKRTQSALYVHRTALETLPPVLRVYEGCAHVLVGEVEGANIIKLHRDHPQISYLSYPNFDSDPHPALQGSLLVNLRSFKTSYREYSESDNPPVLHRKEQFVAEGYECREQFAALTKDEENAGLYEDPTGIGARLAWDRLLAEKGIRIDHHRIHLVNLLPPKDEL